MKRSILALFSSALLCSTLLVNAETVSQEETGAGVEFSQQKIVTTPRDPKDPSKPFPGRKGPLTAYEEDNEQNYANATADNPNDANLTMTRNANDLCIEAFDFDTRPSGSVSQFNGFKMGDRSKADVRQLDGTRTTSVSGSKVEAKNAQPFKGNFDIVQTGDDVTWHQENFGYFARVLQGAGDYIFGQKNTIEIPRITNGNVMTIAYGKRVIFNAGTNFDVR